MSNRLLTYLLTYVLTCWLRQLALRSTASYRPRSDAFSSPCPWPVGQLRSGQGRRSCGLGVLTPWKYVGWAEYVLTPPPPKNVTLFHLTLLLDNSGSFTSSRMKHERHLGQKWKVKLIVRGAYRLSWTGIVERLEIIDVGRNLKQFDGFTWPDWPWPPYFTTYLCHWFLTDILGAEMADDCDIASGFPTVHSRHDTPALFLLLASIQSISGTDSASQVLLFEARSVKAPPSPRDHVTNKHKLLLRRERKKLRDKNSCTIRQLRDCGGFRY